MATIAYWQKRLGETLPETARELVRDTLSNVIVSIGVIYVIWFFVLGLQRPELLQWRYWLIFLIVGCITAVSQRLLKHQLMVAQGLWLAGMLMANALSVILFDQPELIIFFALLPFITVILINLWAGLCVELVIAFSIWILVQSSQGINFNPYILTTLVLGLIAGIVGWAARRTLATATEWSIHYADQAQTNMDEARQHRAQLVLAHKNLDLAYYRLERVNATLVTARKKAEEAERLKSEFVTYISHEMRTPLNLVAGFSETILTSPESSGDVVIPSVYRQDINRISQSAQYLLELIDDIIDLAKVDVGRISIDRESLDIAQLVNESVSMVMDYVHARGLDLHVETSPDLPILEVDRLRIRQVLLNLLVNAVRFTDHGWIRVEVLRQDNGVTVKIIDNGRGIRESDLPHVFEEYRTRRPSDTTWHSGGGLGLPISKKLVELHDGTMGVQSVFGQGATFWFTLPFIQKTAGESPKFEFTGTALVEEDETEPTLILINDDPNVTKVIQRYLEDYRVIEAKTVEDGKAIAAIEQPVAILVSSQLPVTIEDDDSITIRCPLPNWKLHFEWAGVVDILRKPISSEMLQNALAGFDEPIQRILIVEDDNDMVQMLRRMLASMPSIKECQSAWNGREAMKKLRDQIPDLVLLDITLPEVDGYQVLSEMTRDDELRDIPVIVVSGTADDYLTESLDGLVEIRQPGGFRFNDVIRVLSATLNALSPGWHV